MIENETKPTSPRVLSDVEEIGDLKLRVRELEQQMDALLNYWKFEPRHIKEYSKWPNELEFKSFKRTKQTY